MLAALTAKYSVEFHAYSLPWEVAVVMGAGALLLAAAGAGILVWFLKRKPTRRSVP